MMKRTLVVALAAVFASAPVFALAAEGDQQSSHAERMQQWAADRETVLDAKLAGMKAGLALTADQEKLWGPFQSAVQDAARSRMDAMRQIMQTRAQGEQMSPVDHLEAMANVSRKAQRTSGRSPTPPSPCTTASTSLRSISLARLGAC